MRWVSPTGFSDPDNSWIDEANAYDDNPNTYATGTVPPQWGGFLYLTLPTPIQANKLRLMLAGPSTNRNVDVDVKVDGVWVNVFEGAYALWVDTWKEISFGQGNVDQVRIRFYQGYTYPVQCYVRDVDVWEVEAVVPPPPLDLPVIAAAALAIADIILVLAYAATKLTQR